MAVSNEHPTARRDFIAQVAAAAVLAGTACASPLVAATTTADARRAARSDPAFDDSWTTRVSAAKHRAVFDSPQVDDGAALEHVLTYLTGYHTQFGTTDAEVVPVLVMRHMGTMLAFNDDLWDKYEFGKTSKTKDPATGADARRNPFVRVVESESQDFISAGAALPALRARGVVLLACNRALMGLAARQAKARKLDVEMVRAEFRAGLLPGVVLQPSGIYACLRAQEVGCGFIKSS